MDKSKSELLKSILHAIEKHPNAKVSKIIKTFELEKTPQNLALLLIELAEHPEFSADTGISLRYYLDCFERLSHEASFAESGIVLYNSSKIYAKRVDHVQQEIERLILSLSNVEDTKDTTSPPVGGVSQNQIKEKRGRKRPLEQINGPYEANMSAKRFKTLSQGKRFDETKRNTPLKKNVMSDADKDMKSYIPQATWQHSIIQDFDYEDEVDSKKNYKLFTYHLEHRYNTLIADINFKMYFKIKDYIDGAADDSELPESWPPLSDAYIEQYLNLEDAVLLREGHFGRTLDKMETSKLKELSDSLLNKCSGNSKKIPYSTQDSGIDMDGTEDSTICLDLVESRASVCEGNITTRNISSDSAIDLESSVQLDKTIENLVLPVCDASTPSTTTTNPAISDKDTNKASISLDLESSVPFDTTIENLVLPVHDENKTSKPPADNPEDKTKTTEKDPTLLSDSNDKDLSTLKLILPHLSDEAIYMSDLDEQNRQMLSPSVVAQDVFRCVKDKSDIVIKIDDTIEQLFKVKEPMAEFLSLPLIQIPEFTLRLNILKIPLKHFNKRRRFKLGPEYDIRKKERLKKYCRRSAIAKTTTTTTTTSLIRKFVRLGDECQGGHVSPAASPSYEPDWLGFPEESLPDKSRSLSRDSGISLHQTDDFSESPDLLSSTLKSSESMDNIAVKDKEADRETPTPPIESPSNSDEVPEIVKASKEPSEDIDMTTPPNATQSNDKTDELNEEARIRTKVHQWHSHLQPILANSRERHHFDVFALGTEIMTQFDRSDISSDKVSFENVMEEKEESFISRYFLSMLLLANQGNILIDVQNKSTSEPSELHDIRLKLISRKRNIVSLEDNIGLQTTTPTATTATTTTTTVKSKKQSTMTNTIAIVRTLKSVPEVPKMDDRDSGVAMSEECIA